MNKITFPTIADVTSELWAHVKQLRVWKICGGENDDDFSDVRLQVYQNGYWALRTGDSQYDQDHHGFWGFSSVSRKTTKTECREIAADLIEQTKEGGEE